MTDQKAPIIIVRRDRRRRPSFHGGSWKVAYADFVTAMMAFFLVMWLLSVTTQRQREAVSDYFRNPSLSHGSSTVEPSGALGPGGASTSMIRLGSTSAMPQGPGSGGAGVTQVDASAAERRARMIEHHRLQALMRQLHAAIEKSQALRPFKDQLLLDITPDGLRIQIVDKKNRPMFDLGSDRLKPYTARLLHELAGFLNAVPNRISITGHTDDARYSSIRGYSNWELSADRANAARRALVAGGMSDGKIERVVGLAATVPFDKADPGAPLNRRISILVMSKAAMRATQTAALKSIARLRQALPAIDGDTVKAQGVAVPHGQARAPGTAAVAKRSDPEAAARAVRRVLRKAHGADAPKRP